MRTGPLIALLLGLLLAGLAAFLLLRTPDTTAAPNVLRHSTTQPAEPTFHGDPGAPHKSAASALTPAEARPLPAGEEPAPSAAAEAPSVPTRRIAGRVVRRSDDTPLPHARVRAVAERGQGERSTIRLPSGTTFTADMAIVSGNLDGLANPGDGVTLSGEHWTVTLGETTDEDGAFAFAAVPTSVREVVVTGVEGWPEHPATFPLPDVAGDIAGLELTYDSGFQVRGTVRDIHGAPLPGATVGVGDAPRITTDTFGVFAMRDVTAEKDKLTVTCHAQAPLHVRDSKQLTVPKDSAQTVTVDFALEGSGAIEGTITDTDGQPVPGTSVRVAVQMTASHGESSPEHLSAKSGDDGRYRVDHVTEGRYLVQAGTDPDPQGETVVLPPVDAGQAVPAAVPFAIDMSFSVPRGLAPRWIPDVEVHTGQVTRLDVVLDQGGIVEGRVTDSGGVPLAGAHVKLERLVRWPAPELQDGSSTSFDGTSLIVSTGGHAGAPGESVYSSTERSASTGEDGRFHFEHLPAGEKRLTAIDKEQLCAPQKQTVIVQGTEVHAAVDFVLALGLSVRGRVTDKAGRPLEGASVNVKPADTHVFGSEGTERTDADGWFEARGLAAGEHAIAINMQGYSFFWGKVTPGDPPRTYQLTPSPKLHGLVTDAATGEPLVHYGMSISTENSIMTSGDDEHADGSFVSDVNDDQPCSVEITAVGYESQKKDSVIPSTTAVAPLQFRLKPKP